MHTATTDLPASVLRTRPVWVVSALAGATAAAATELYGLAARAAGIPMAAGSIGARRSSSLPSPAGSPRVPGRHGRRRLGAAAALEGSRIG